MADRLYERSCYKITPNPVQINFTSILSTACRSRISNVPRKKWGNARGAEVPCPQNFHGRPELTKDIHYHLPPVYPIPVAGLHQFISSGPVMECVLTDVFRRTAEEKGLE